MSRRLPHSVYDDGRDPDPRFSLANERTFLAWIRTALSLVAGAIAVHAPALGFPAWVRIGISVLLLVLAGLAVSQSWARWRRTEIAMRSGGPLPGFTGALVFASGMGLLVGAALAASLLNH